MSGGRCGNSWKGRNDDGRGGRWRSKLFCGGIFGLHVNVSPEWVRYSDLAAVGKRDVQLSSSGSPPRFLFGLTLLTPRSQRNLLSTPNPIDKLGRLTHQRDFYLSAARSPARIRVGKEKRESSR